MNPTDSNSAEARRSRTLASPIRQIERREWWLWGFVVIVNLLLTAAVASFAFPWLRAEADGFYWIHIAQSVPGLVGLVLLFDLLDLSAIPDSSNPTTIE